MPSGDTEQGTMQALTGSVTPDREWWDAPSVFITVINIESFTAHHCMYAITNQKTLTVT